MGKDGLECPGFCQVDPHMCGPETTWCDGGFDQNECQMPNMCVPFANMKGSVMTVVEFYSEVGEIQ